MTYTYREAEITGLLNDWSQGDTRALDRLLPLVFDDLHRMARYFFHRESDTHTLQPTALVNEIYFRLRGQRNLEFESRADFFNSAADLMRHFLVDYARIRKAEKRGGGLSPIDIQGGELDSLLNVTPRTPGILDLHLALEELKELDLRQAQIVNLRFFLGLQVVEVAELLEISDSTVKREWRLAKIWLRRRLETLGEEVGE